MISIVTTYFNRKKQFINTLKSLLKSSYKDFEMIAVDDGSDENERIEDLQKEFSFLKVFRIDKNEKKYHNPCIPFNLAFSKSKGDKIIIQNPECLHLNDILQKTNDSLNDKNYLSFACYSVDQNYTNKFNETGNINLFYEAMQLFCVPYSYNGQNGWYNHSIFRPESLHFCTAITRNNLKKLNGFDERYAEGSAYDDNEFIHRVKLLGLKIEFQDNYISIHQYHENFNYIKDGIRQLENKNANLFKYITLNENKIRANPDKEIMKQKIIGFTQLRNELSKGNLENWFRQMQVCDYIYIFDQNSDDGSQEYYKKFKNTVVIESKTNRFYEELICKQELLSKLLSDHPNTDWILWLDGDLLLDGRLLKNNGEQLYKLCSLAEENGADACFFDHYNLWRSDLYYRVDDQYHGLSGNWCALWKNNGNLHYNACPGLHGKQYPDGLTKGMRTSFACVHRGFATDYQIITKYNVYKSNGQNGWALDRLLNENGLQVELLKKELLPEWFEIKDIINPINKKKIIDIYNEKNK